MSVKGYNRLASSYVWLERVAFGRALIKARLALLAELNGAKSILVLGEGDGRFLASLLEHLPHAQIVVIEQSPKMIARAKKRLTSLKRVRFVCADALTVSLDESFDVIVTCFFLDLFDDAQIAQLMQRVIPYLKLSGFWYYADFVVPRASLEKIYALLYLKLMFWFFAWQTSFKQTQLVNPHSFFLATGFTLKLERRSHFNFLTTRLYQKL